MSARPRVVTMRTAPACSTTHSSVRLPARAAGARASLRQHTPAARTRRSGDRLRCAAAKEDGAPEESKEPADQPVDVPAPTGAEADGAPHVTDLHAAAW